jgi:hypothetical protein
LVVAHLYHELVGVCFLCTFWVSSRMSVKVLKICVAFNAGSG